MKLWKLPVDNMDFNASIIYIYPYNHYVMVRVLTSSTVDRGF